MSLYSFFRRKVYINETSDEKKFTLGNGSHNFFTGMANHDGAADADSIAVY